MNEDRLFARPEKIEYGSSTLSFKDCPYKCVDGKRYDPYNKVRSDCPYCSEKRRQLVKRHLQTADSKDIYKILNLPTSFTGDVFNPESVITARAKKDITSESVEKVLTKMKELYQQVSAGVASENSCLFNLGIRCFESNFVYPYLLRSYQSGLLTSPYVTDYDVDCLYNCQPSFIEGIEYEDLIKADVLVVTILAGSSRDRTFRVKGLMEMRSHYDRSTLIFTKEWNNLITQLAFNADDDTQSKSLATLYSVEYNDRYKTEMRERERQFGVSASKPSGLTEVEYKKLLGL